MRLMATSRREFGARLDALLLLPLAMSGPARSAGGRTHKIEICNFAFSPAELTIAPGDTVEWVNADIVPHTATEQHDAAWDTGELKRGQSGKLTFGQTGTQAYYCAFHPNMKGRIQVRST